MYNYNLQCSVKCNNITGEPVKSCMMSR